MATRSDAAIREMENRRLRLRQWIDEKHGGVQAAFVAAHKLNQGEISALLKDKSFGSVKARNLEAKTGMPERYLEMRPSEFPGNAFASSVDTLLHNQDEEANVEDGPDIRGRGRYPLISFVQAGEWTAICDNFQPNDAEEWPVTHHNLGPCGYVLRVKGPSMTAEGQKYSFPDGMLLFVNPDKHPSLGQFVIVRREREKAATFKKLTSVDGDLFLEALNPNWPKRYIPLEPGDTFCGVVVDASFGNLP